MWYRASHARRLWQTEHRRRNQLRELFAYMRALRCTLEWDIKARDELRYSCHTQSKRASWIKADLLFLAEQNKNRLTLEATDDPWTP